MENFANFIIDYWLRLGILTGIFWGIYSVYFFTPEIRNLSNANSMFINKYPNLRCFFIASYQFIFNFMSSLFGFGALCLFSERYFEGKLGIAEIVLFSIAFIGITGNLPQTIRKGITHSKPILELLMKKLSWK